MYARRFDEQQGSFMYRTRNSTVYKLDTEIPIEQVQEFEREYGDRLVVTEEDVTAAVQEMHAERLVPGTGPGHSGD